uniref:OPA3-like protein n=1 Tax=Oryza meridionalis TaxID=40149 RepID=A0A0E0BZU5_9ORYZ
MSLPVAKLGTLALRTLSKPIASRLKNQAAVHPKFRNFIICIAQINHRVTTRIQRRIYGHATDVEITPLNEEKAVQAATDLIGEGFIFSVAVAALIFEVQRSARSEARKEEARKQELEVELKQREESLSKDLEDLKLRLAEIERLAKGRGLSGILNFKGVHGAESSKAATPA